MVAGLPFLQLVPLAWKFATKPIEDGFKRYIQRNDRFRAGVVRFGNRKNYWLVWLRYKLHHLERTPEQILKESKINEDRAITTGVELATNTFSAIVAIVFLYGMQYYRSEQVAIEKEKQAAHRRNKDQSVQRQIAELQGLKCDMKCVQRRIEEMAERIEQLENNQKSERS